jgi:RimJ/RimL family protein N-acetyltransferase
MAKTPPYRLESERLVVRCWQPSDARLLDEAIGSSVEHLRPWMPWIVREPLAFRDRIEFLRSARAYFDRDEDYPVGVFDRTEKRVLGGAGLHKRLGPVALEIGYWIRQDSVRRGLCTEVAALLTHVAFVRCGVERVEIHADPANTASQGVPAKLGFHRDAVLRRRARTPEGAPRDTAIWSMFADELRSSPIRDLVYTAFDACGDVAR